MRTEYARVAACSILLAVLSLNSASDAKADACWDHWRAKLNAQNAVTIPLQNKLKKTGDCSLIDQIIASSDRYKELLRQIPCQHMTIHIDPNSHANIRKALEPYCKPQQLQAKVAPPAATTPSSSGSCSDITGTGGGPGRSNCTPSNGVPPNIQSEINQAQSNTNAPPPPHVVVMPPPQCSGCDALITVGELVPDLAEKLNNIRPETINDVEPPRFDGGPNTLHPFLPRSPLAPVSEPEDPVQFIDEMKDIANKSKALSDLADKNNEPEDYAKNCQDKYLDGAWKAFTAKDGSYGERAKAAMDSFWGCLKKTFKYMEDTLSKGGMNVTDPALEDH
jgi:hypothetical protein